MLIENDDYPLEFCCYELILPLWKIPVLKKTGGKKGVFWDFRLFQSNDKNEGKIVGYVTFILHFQNLWKIINIYLEKELNFLGYSI